MNRLRIAFVSTHNAKNINKWSGTVYYMSKTIEKYIGEVEYFGNLTPPISVKSISKIIWYKKIKGQVYETWRIDIAKRYSKYLEKKLNGKNFDIVFCPSTLHIANLNTNIPIIFWTDANFQGMINYYSKNWNIDSIKIGNSVEKNALDRSSLAIYSSDWAANGAIDFYKIKPDKVKVIPFGANMDNITSVQND